MSFILNHSLHEKQRTQIHYMLLQQYYNDKVVSRAGRQVDSLSPLASLQEKQRTQIHDMLPQQYYNEKVHIFRT